MKSWPSTWWCSKDSASAIIEFNLRHSRWSNDLRDSCDQLSHPTEFRDDLARFWRHRATAEQMISAAQGIKRVEALT
jgi:hypothetical protein